MSSSWKLVDTIRMPFLDLIVLNNLLDRAMYRGVWIPVNRDSAFNLNKLYYFTI